MSARGVYKKGYYLALLHALDLFYRLESQRAGRNPGRWQPLPRKRVDQFLTLVVDSLSEVESPPDRYAAFLERLEALELTYLAQALDFSVRRRLGAHQKPLRLGRVLAALSGDSSPELYPQARKLTQLLREHLDPLWKEALLDMKKGTKRGARSSAAVVLGGLPPGFAVTYAQVARGLAAQFQEGQPNLSVAQFYGLVTGGLPAAPEPWRPVLRHLGHLSTDAASLLKNLSEQQLEQLKTLDQSALKLVIQLRSLRRATPHWRRLVTEIGELNATTERSVDAAVERWRRQYGVSIRHPEEVGRLIRPATWRRVETLDEELLRMIDRREVTLALVKQVQGWDAALWSQVRSVLRDDWLWLTAFNDDKKQVARLSSLRTPAQMRLRDLFPKSIAWLDEQFLAHRQELLLLELDEVITDSDRYAAQVTLTLLTRHAPSYPRLLTPDPIRERTREPAVLRGLLETFKSWGEQRKARGRVYPQWLILSLATLAELCGHISFLGAARFTARHPELLAYLGLLPQRGLPSHDTFRYALRQCDPSQRRSAVENWAESVLGEPKRGAASSWLRLLHEQSLQRCYEQVRRGEVGTQPAPRADLPGKGLPEGEADLPHPHAALRGVVSRYRNGEQKGLSLELDFLSAVVAAELLTNEFGLKTLITQRGEHYRVSAHETNFSGY